MVYVAVSDRVIGKETVVGRRLLCGKLYATGNLGRFRSVFGVDNSGCESMCMRETMLAFLQLFGRCEVLRLLEASCVTPLPWSR